MIHFFGDAFLSTQTLLTHLPTCFKFVRKKALATIDKALDLGINFLDTAAIYIHTSGATNEELVGKAIKVLFLYVWKLLTAYTQTAEKHVDEKLQYLLYNLLLCIIRGAVRNL